MASLFASLTSASGKNLFRAGVAAQGSARQQFRNLRNFDCGRTFDTILIELRRRPRMTPQDQAPPPPERPRPPFRRVVVFTGKP
jgi:hypothetical protein